jgi:hypothetical protein
MMRIVITSAVFIRGVSQAEKSHVAASAEDAKLLIGLGKAVEWNEAKHGKWTGK